METIIYADSPLAAYLEGEGKGDVPWTTSTPLEQPPPHHHDGPDHQSFAPRGPSTFQQRLRQRLPKPLSVKIPSDGPVGKIHRACSKALNSRVGSADNARFLEHFRYIIVASQSLNDHLSHGGQWMPNLDGGAQPLAELKLISSSLTGAVVTATTAFTLVWLIHWSRGGRNLGLSKSRAVMVLAAFVIVATVLYAYLRRQWLQYLRQQSVAAASTLVTNLQAFDASASATITLVQEVELVARGYRISTPMPPISRLDEKNHNRRCSRLRRNLSNALKATVPAFSDACETIRGLVEEDDLEKYLDIYDINNQDIQEAALGYSEAEFDDFEALKALRILLFRLSTQQRVLLCTLLSLEADGGRADFFRWRTALETMERLAFMTGEWSTKLNNILVEEEQFVVPAAPKVPTPSTPNRERLRAQVRKLSSLSQGIRGLQAKMQILREESNKSLEDTEDLTELGPSLMAQYESIGTDLKSLVQAWESGKASLILNIDRHERRISQASSGLRSPAVSLGGLTAVDEGSPSDALRALNGETSIHSSISSGSGNVSDEEIFEAIALPRQRKSITREERIHRMQEERARQTSLREKRETSTNMIRELESVINLKRSPHGRITSI